MLLRQRRDLELVATSACSRGHRAKERRLSRFALAHLLAIVETGWRLNSDYDSMAATIASRHEHDARSCLMSIDRFLFARVYMLMRELSDILCCTTSVNIELHSQDIILQEESHFAVSH